MPVQNVGGRFLFAPQSHYRVDDLPRSRDVAPNIHRFKAATIAVDQSPTGRHFPNNLSKREPTKTN
jgi:hypothetical protein